MNSLSIKISLREAPKVLGLFEKASPPPGKQLAWAGIGSQEWVCRVQKALGRKAQH